MTDKKQTRRERELLIWVRSLIILVCVFFGLTKMFAVDVKDLQQENTQLKEKQVSYGFSSNGTIWIYENGWSAYNYANGSWYKNGEKWYSKDGLCRNLKNNIFEYQDKCPFPNERNVALSEDCIKLNYYDGYFKKICNAQYPPCDSLMSEIWNFVGSADDKCVKIINGNYCREENCEEMIKQYLLEMTYSLP